MENMLNELVEKKSGFWTNMLIKPIGCPTFLLLGGWLTLVFQYIYHPIFYYFTWAILIFLIWIPLLIYFVLRSIVQKIAKAMHPNIHTASEENRKRWIAFFLIPACLNLLTLTRLPLHVCFWFTKPHLQRLVDKIKSGEFYKELEGDKTEYSYSIDGNEITVLKYIYTGIYDFDQMEIYPKDSTNPEHVEFHLADDCDAEFIYCTTGLESIFTSGAAEHL